MAISPLAAGGVAFGAGLAATVGTKIAVGEGGDVGAVTTREIDKAVGFSGAALLGSSLLFQTPSAFTVGTALLGASIVSAFMGGALQGKSPSNG